MTVFLEAIFLAPFVLASQNRLSRQADKRSHLDLQIDLLAEREMTVVQQLLQDVASHLKVKTSVTPEQLRDLMKKTDLRRLTNRMEELAEPSTSPASIESDSKAESSHASASWLATVAESPSSLGSAFAFRDRVLETVSLSWSELARRTWREVIDDDVLGLAAQLSYYFFLALFPAILFLLAVASFFPLSNLTDDVGRSLGPFVSPQVLALIQEQMRRLANNENGGLLTFGVAGALWSSSAALVSIVGALNRAYDIDEGRPWWKVRLVAIGLTLSVALIILIALSLVLVGPTLAEKLGQTTGWGAPLEWTWLVLQWPLVFALVATGIGLIYYLGPDVDQDWVWITPGAVAATILWLVISLLFKVYIAKFTDYEGSYGTVGGVIVVLLWFYVSGIAILTGAELNAELEHASPYGKAPGQKNAQGKLLIGARAARAFRQRQLSGEPAPVIPAPPTPPPPKPGLGAAVAVAILVTKWWNRRANNGRRGEAARTS
jgi:membrane protein